MKNNTLTKKQKKKLIRIIVSLIIFITLFVFDLIFDLSTIFVGHGRWIFPFILYFLNYIVIGYDIILKAVKNIRHGQIFDENFLMITATLGAFGLAIYKGVNDLKIDGFDEACAVIIFYQIGEFFQSYAVSKSRKSISKLMDIRPDYANLKFNNEIKVVNPSEVKVDDIIVVNPGEKIPIDGIIIKGETSLDTRAINGESILKDVQVGDEVISGTINLQSQIEVKVTKIFYDSTVYKILNLIENVSTKKSKSENFISKFARFYTPIVCIFALFLAIVPSIISKNWSIWTYRALSFLVVSCPCALVISIPLSFFVGVGLASKNGILVKGSSYFETLDKVNIFIFDKTGTITEGNFEIIDIFPKEKEKEILELAAIAEQYSNHPIAESIKIKFNGELQNNFSITNISGNGVIANNETTQILCGNEKLMKKYNISFINKAKFGTSIFVSKNGEYIGQIVLADKIKDESKLVIDKLSKDNNQIIMLTGDNEIVANYIANEVGINNFHASLLPQDKVEEISNLIKTKTKRDAVCFVGDGVNDAPSLMLADVGISMGGIGSDAAIEASDIVLMRDNLTGILQAKKISKLIMRKVFQNIIFSISVKILILLLATFGVANMWLAIFGDVGVAIIAIINAISINSKKYNNSIKLEYFCGF